MRDIVVANIATLLERGIVAQIGNEFSGVWVCKFVHLGRCLTVGSHKSPNLNTAIAVAASQALGWATVVKTSQNGTR